MHGTCVDSGSIMVYTGSSRNKQMTVWEKKERQNPNWLARLTCFWCFYLHAFVLFLSNNNQPAILSAACGRLRACDDIELLGILPPMHLWNSTLKSPSTNFVAIISRSLRAPVWFVSHEFSLEVATQFPLILTPQCFSQSGQLVICWLLIQIW